MYSFLPSCIFLQRKVGFFSKHRKHKNVFISHFTRLAPLEPSVWCRHPGLCIERPHVCKPCRKQAMVYIMWNFLNKFLKTTAECISELAPQNFTHTVGANDVAWHMLEAAKIIKVLCFYLLSNDKNREMCQPTLAQYQ